MHHFKKLIDDIATKHTQEHLDDYMHGKFSAIQRRLLLTNWVGHAWEEISTDRQVVLEWL